jgi:hypothetical protein
MICNRQKSVTTTAENQRRFIGRPAYSLVTIKTDILSCILGKGIQFVQLLHIDSVCLSCSRSRGGVVSMAARLEAGQFLCWNSRRGKRS